MERHNRVLKRGWKLDVKRGIEDLIERLEKKSIRNQCFSANPVTVTNSDFVSLISLIFSQALLGFKAIRCTIKCFIGFQNQFALDRSETLM